MPFDLFEDRAPAVRSRDYALCLSDPFRYFLTRRCGLTTFYTPSEALSCGSWFHLAFQHHELPPEAFHSVLDSTFTLRADEIRTRAVSADSITPAFLDAIIKEERHRMLMAKAWWMALNEVPLPSDPRTLSTWLSDRNIIAYEYPLELTFRLPSHPATPIRARARFDAFYVSPSNSLWILDPKTCSESTIDRLQRCPIEFQTQHYLYLARLALRTGHLRHAFPNHINADTTLGGIIHVAIQKPTIRFGQNDRLCEVHMHELQRGPRRGQIEERRTYHGEPQFDLYVERCIRWMKQEGEFAGNPNRVSEPVVNFSTISFPSSSPDLDTTYFREYLTRLEKVILPYQRAEFDPDEFPKSDRPSGFGAARNDRFLPFYFTPKEQWRQIAFQQGLIPAEAEDEDDPSAYASSEGDG